MIICIDDNFAAGAFKMLSQRDLFRVCRDGLLGLADIPA